MGRLGKRRVTASGEEVVTSLPSLVQERWRAVWALGAACCFPDFSGTATQQPTQMSVEQASMPGAFTGNHFPSLASGTCLVIWKAHWPSLPAGTRSPSSLSSSMSTKHLARSSESTEGILALALIKRAVHNNDN